MAKMSRAEAILRAHVTTEEQAIEALQDEIAARTQKVLVLRTVIAELDKADATDGEAA